MEVVFDCSAIMACLAPDEAPPVRWRTLLAEANIVAPALLPTELTNALCMAQRRGRLNADELGRAAAQVKLLAIDCEAPSIARSLDDVRDVVAEYGLTAYDAAYLELALRRHLPLATLDKDLRRAAAKARIKLI